MSETFDAALRRGAAALKAARIDSAVGDARARMLWAAEIDAVQLTMRLREDAPGTVLAKFKTALDKRVGRQPVSQIIGGRLFWGRWFEVTSDVLDPRPESEIMIVRALVLPRPKRVLELGVGSGCILGTVLAERPGAIGLGIDISDAALSVARRNLEFLGVSERGNLQKGDWLAGITDSFDLVLCNPPYIAEDEMSGLSPEVRLYEPHMALSPGGDGLASYRAIAPTLRRVMATGGTALFEIGPTQAKAVADIFAEFDWAKPEVLKDFDGRDRCLAFTV